jgi:hypothetical protein
VYPKNSHFTVRDFEMKIKMVVSEEDITYRWYSVEIETDNYEELKNLPIDEVRHLIENEEVELNEYGDSYINFVKEEGKLVREKESYGSTDIVEFEEVKD